MSEPNRYEHDLLEVCERIHDFISGSGDGIPYDTALELRDWLAWRTTGGWERSLNADTQRYDSAVRELCLAALF